MRHSLLALALLLSTPVLAQTPAAKPLIKPTGAGNTSGLFQQGRAAQQITPGVSAQPAAKPNIPVSQNAGANGPASASANAPYDGCVNLIKAMKKSFPDMAEQATADRYVASHRYQSISYQYICTRSGRFTLNVAPTGAAPTLPNTPQPGVGATPTKPTIPVKAR